MRKHFHKVEKFRRRVKMPTKLISSSMNVYWYSTNLILIDRPNRKTKMTQWNQQTIPPQTSRTIKLWFIVADNSEYSLIYPLTGAKLSYDPYDTFVYNSRIEITFLKQLWTKKIIIKQHFNGYNDVRRDLEASARISIPN